MTRLVAEALPRPRRLRLLRRLHAQGMTDDEIATATSWTTYTAARLLRSLDLAPNPRSASPSSPGEPACEGTSPVRIRSIKPEFWRSDDITALSREHRLLFIGLWSYVDDNGVGVDDYRAIAADLFALDDDQSEVRQFVRDGLATLSRGLLIARYVVDGKSYLYVTGWKKHQRIDRPAKPRYPEPPAGWKPPTSENVPDREPGATPSRHPREPVATGTGEQGNRGTEEGGRPGNSGTDRARERIGPAHSGRAHRLVEAYAATCPRRPPAKIRSQLAVEVDGLIDVDWPDHEITAAIDLWASKGLGPGALQSVAHELANRRPATGARSGTDANIAALLGSGSHLAPEWPPLRALGGAG